MKLGKFDCSTGLINILYNDNLLNISVRTSTIKDMLLVDKLQKENSYAVGFKASADINLWKIDLNKNILTLFK